MKYNILILLLVISLPSILYGAEAKGKISKNMYRIPYADGVEVDVTNNYIKHGSSPSGITGPFDMHGVDAGELIVAAADGRVVNVVDTIDGCGCDMTYGPCANFISIDHANNEQTQYVHIAQGSALVNIGDCVVAGQPIATEGDIGFTCGNTRSATAGVCIPVVPNGAGDCGRHLHLNVLRKVGSWEYINPMTCGVGSWIYDSLTSYTANPCDSFTCGVIALPLSGTVWSGYLNMHVYQATDSIWSENSTIQDTAAIVMRAGTKIHLKPGFHAKTSCYFRAEIEDCNTSSDAGCPPPVPGGDNEIKEIEFLAD